MTLFMAMYVQTILFEFFIRKIDIGLAFVWFWFFAMNIFDAMLFSHFHLVRLFYIVDVQLDEIRFFYVWERKRGKKNQSDPFK